MIFIYRYILKAEKEKKESHNKIINRYRNKRLATEKKIEVWIKQPICLEVLKKQSGLNQTQIINQLLEIISDGVDHKFYSTEKEKKDNLKDMSQKISDVFS